MAKVNKDKTDRVAVLAKIRQMISYQDSSIGCGCCSWSDQDNWSDEGVGKCNFLKGIPFTVREEAICRHHSLFDK